ncbi:MAG: deoxyribonuclease IV [Candidatus Colwellbacteria bacterium]
MKIPLLGGHVSVAGGLYKAGEAAADMGAKAIQIFGASPRQWRANLPTPENIERYKKAIDEAGVESVYLHGAYLVNLASEGEIFEKSVKNLTTHFEIANIIGADGLIFHIGSDKGGDRDRALNQIASGMRKVLGAVKEGKSKLIVENASGGKGKIGTTIEEIAGLLDKVDSSRVACCLDTAHVFEAGVLDFSDAEVKKFFDTWDEKIGMDKLLVLHINDSKTSFGSGVDRHENLGKGEIGLEGFRALAKETRLKDTSWILEVPGFTGEGPDKKNLDILKGVFE